MKEPLKITCLVITSTGASSKAHQHSTWEDLARCADGREIAVMVTDTPTEPKAPATGALGTPTAVAPRAVPAAPAAEPTPAVSIRNKTARPTAKQLFKVEKLGGSWRDATENNREEVSQLITILDDPSRAAGFKLPEGAGFEDEAWDLYPKEVQWRQGLLREFWATPFTWEDAMAMADRDSGPGEHKPSAWADPPAAPKPLTARSKLEAMLPLLDSVPDGYFGIDLYGDEKNIKYLRVDRVTHGAKKGCLKIQTVHGDRLEDAWAKWPSGKISVYSFEIEELILALMTDHAGAARRYARTIGKCCRCRKRLTDERSRHYGIGPECEKYRPEIIAMVDLEDSMA